MVNVYFPTLIAAAPEDQIGPQGLDWALDNIDAYDVGIYDKELITPFVEDNHLLVLSKEYNFMQIDLDSDLPF